MWLGGASANNIDAVVERSVGATERDVVKHAEGEVGASAWCFSGQTRVGLGISRAKWS